MDKKATVALILLILIMPELAEPAYGMINTKNFEQPTVLNFNFFSHIISKVANILGKFMSGILRFISFFSGIKNSVSATEYDYLHPYIFEGVHYVFSYPYVVKYYNSSTVQQYWNQANISSNVPVLQLNNAQEWTQGLVFWNESYTSGKNVTITFTGVYSSGVLPVADGFEAYLFLKPTMWSVSPYWNESERFPTLISNNATIYPSVQNKTAQGELALPQSLTRYIIVQWDPWWQIGTGKAGLGGQWNIRIVYNQNNNYNSLIYFAYSTEGEGNFTPNPGNYILFSVTYVPSNNTIIGIAKDLNTSQEAILIFQMPYYFFFSNPSSGNYVFGIGASTGGSNVANWGIVYTNIPALKPLFLRSPIKVYNVTFTQTGLPSGTSWSVTVTGETFYGLYINKTLTSTASTITFALPNGTYYYRIGNVSGYKAYQTTGEIKVSGENSGVNIYFVSLNWKTLEQNLAYSNGYIFYANSTFDKVEVIDATTGKVVKVFRTGIYPVTVASYYTLAMEYGGVFNEYRDIVVVANEGSNNVTFINSSSLQIIGGISVGEEPLGIALGNGVIAVSNYGSKSISIIAIFESPSFVPFIVNETPLSDSPTGVVFNPTTNELFVSLYNTHKIAMYKVSLSSFSVSLIEYLQTQANPMGLAIDPNGWLYVAQEGTSYVGIFVPMNVTGVPPPYQPPCSLCYPAWPTYTVKVGNHPVNVIAITTPSDSNSQEVSVVVSYLNSSNVSFIPVSLIENNIQNQQLYFNITYPGVVSGIAPGNSSWYYVAGGIISSTPVYPIFFNYSGGQVAYSINDLVFEAPATIPLPPGIYNLSYSLEIGYTSPKLLTCGGVYYRNTSNTSEELAVYSHGTVIINSTEILTNWMNSGYFNVTPISVPIGDIISLLFPPTFFTSLFYYFLGKSPALLTAYYATVYVLYPVNGENFFTFYGYLHYFFNITVPSGYLPFMTVIISMPIASIMSAIFGTKFSEFPLGEYLSFLGVRNIITDSNGTLNLAITISVPQNGILSLEEALINSLPNIADTILTFRKNISIISYNSIIDLITLILKNMIDMINVVKSLGDITATVITASLKSIGKLSGYTLFDLVTMENYIEIALNKTIQLLNPQIPTQIKIVLDIISIVFSAVSLPDDPVAAAKSLAASTLDLINNIIKLTSKSLYQKIAPFINGVKAGLKLIDPNGSIIVPSFYVNNTLALGYNASNGNMIFQSRYGVLEQLGNTYYVAYIYPQYSHWITVKLINIGGNSPAPYVLTLETNSSYLSFTGMVPGNSSLSIPVLVNSSGLIKSITYLSPKLTVKQEANSYLFTVNSYLSNGEPYNATSAILIIGNKDFYMTKVNATTFQISIPYSQVTSNVIMAYIPSSQYPGGYASAYLPMYKVIFVENGLPNGTLWNVRLNNITEFSYSNEIVFYELNGNYSFSIGTVNGYVVHPSNGTILVNETNVIVNLTFINKNVTTTTSTTTSSSSTTTTQTSTTTSSVSTTVRQTTTTSTVNTTTNSVPITPTTAKTSTSQPNYIIYIAIVIIVIIAVVVYLVTRRR